MHCCVGNDTLGNKESTGLPKKSGEVNSEVRQSEDAGKLHYMFKYNFCINNLNIFFNIIYDYNFIFKHDNSYLVLERGKTGVLIALLVLAFVIIPFYLLHKPRKVSLLGLNYDKICFLQSHRIMYDSLYIPRFVNTTGYCGTNDNVGALGGCLQFDMHSPCHVHGSDSDVAPH